MRRLLTPGVALIAAVALGACGGGDGGGDDEASSAAAKPDSTKTVSIRKVDGIGNVLVDAQGKALYTADQEEDGKIRCEDSCTSFWQPLAAPSGELTTTGDVGKLDTIKRPDGTMQVTADGKPLYTFTEDTGDKVTGDGFSDDFGKLRFTWHAARAKGEAASSEDDGESGGGAPPSRSDYGY